MTDYRFILNKLGIVQAVYSFPNDPAETNPSVFPQFNPLESQNMTTGRHTELMTTYLGTPVFADIILSNQAENRTIQLIASVVEVSQSKIIERTTVRGRNGTVKEYWSMDDYSVRIRGAVIDKRPDYYPKEVVDTLQLLLAESDSLKIVSRFLQMFGIYEITVKDYTFLPIEGKTNCQFFDIVAFSDEPEELIVKNEK
jgi:Domain of unknown function (DUF6046)